MSTIINSSSNIDAIDAVTVRHNGAAPHQRQSSLLDQISAEPEPESAGKKAQLAVPGAALQRQASPTPTDTLPKTKKPKSTALKQQRLPAWQPILTANTVLPLFFAIGCAFVVLGSVILHYSNTVDEFSYDYT